MMHKHHIVPKHMGGRDHPSNIMELTLDEHIMFHWMLYNLYGHKEDLWAVHKLTHGKGVSLEGENNPMKQEWVQERHRAGIARREAAGRNGMKNPEVAKRVNNHPNRVIWNKGKKTGQVPWNKGLTKETDSRCRGNTKAAEKPHPCDCGCGKSYSAGNYTQHRQRLKRKGLI